MRGYPVLRVPTDRKEKKKKRGGINVKGKLKKI
jgi:hypothetical protein